MVTVAMNYKRTLVKILYDMTFAEGAPLVYQTEGVPKDAFLQAVSAKESIPLFVFRKKKTKKAKAEQLRKIPYYLDTLISDFSILGTSTDKLKVSPMGERYISSRYYLDLIG